MKLFKIGLIILVSCNCSFAQLSINKKLKLLNNGDLFGTAMLSTHDSGFVLSGSQGITNSMYYKVIAKYDKFGNYLWCTKSLSGNSSESVNGIFETNSHGFLLTGQINPGPFINSAIVHKIDSNGLSQWRGKIFTNFSFDTEGRNSIETSNNIYTAGTAFSQQLPAYVTYLFKLDSAGYLLWRKTYTNNTSDYFKNKGLIQTLDGNLILTGTYSSSNNNKLYLMKIDTTGNIQWFKTYANSNNNLKMRDIIELLNGNLLFMGLTNTGFYLIETDSAGNINWCKEYYILPIPLEEPRLTTVNNSDLIITESISNGTLKGSLILKLDLSGNIIISYLISQPLLYYRTSQIAQFGINKIANYTFVNDTGVSNHYSYLALMDNISNLNGYCNLTSYPVNDSMRTLTVDTINMTWLNITYINYLRETPATVVDTIIDSTLCVSTSINEIVNYNTGIIIKPNPIKSLCLVSAENFINSSLIIFDLTGRILTTKEFDKETLLDVSFLKSGMYLIEIRDKNGNKIKEKIVKG